MPRGDKAAGTDKQKRRTRALEEGQTKKSATRPETGARAWVAANQLHGAGKKIGSRRKLPSGPLGGSGRKTNLARSS